MLKQIFESVLSKLGELIADRAQINVNHIKNFELTLKTLERNLKSLRAKASDVDEEVKNAEQSGQKKRKRFVDEWLGEVESIETEVVGFLTEVEPERFISRFMVGEKTTQLNEQVCKLAEQAPRSGQLVVDVGRANGVNLLTTRMVGEAFAGNMERIWSLLMSGEVLSIGVHGMGGGGKTTLAKHIHNRLREESKGRVFWVTVSQEFTIKSLQDKIGRFLGVHFYDEDDEDIRATRLYGALSRQKSSVVILDDVWENIDLVKVGCPFSVECCRLIITTRSLEVCHHIGCQKVITVQKLDEDEAWALFNETFTLGKEIKLAPQVEEIVKSLAKLCDGLPLGIITLAGSMRGETAIHTWANALAVLKESVVGQDVRGEVEIFKVLRYSFDRLNTNNHQSQSNPFNLFQLCFLYCSLHPEDREIPRWELVSKFISEGLVDQRKSRKAQYHQGQMVLDKLVNICLLESCAERNEYVKMHDLVRDMALKICEGKYLVRAGDYWLQEIPMEQEWTRDLEKVSLMRNGIWRIGEGTSPDCPNLSTLLLHDNPLKVIPDSFFSKMQGLRTLDLCQAHITKLPNSISELKRLEALLLECCESLEIVPHLGKLKALRELKLEYTAIKEVPRGVEELLNLRFLSLDAPQLKVFPRGILPKFGRLQVVRFPCHVHVAIEEIENLRHVEDFRGGVENVREFNSFITSRVHDHTIYTIQVGSLGEVDDDFGDCDRAVVLTECSLDFEGEKLLGQDLEFLSMKKCEGLSKCFLNDFPQFNNPTSLKRLIIEKCGGIECILTSEQLMNASQISALDFIQLHYLEDLKGMIEKGEIGGASAPPPPPQAVFSSLKFLQIYYCNKMRKLGISVLELPNLEFIEIASCQEIQEIFEDEDAGSDVILTKLETLWLTSLPKLRSICEASIICISIENINFCKCPNLVKKLPLHLDASPPPTLNNIHVDKEWKESMKLVNPDLQSLIQYL